MSKIHPTAVIDPQAELSDDVEVGPYAIIEAGARISAGCRIAGHAQLLNRVILGENCVVSAGAIIGGDPQDLKFEPKTPSSVEIGPGNTFREHVTIHRSASAEGATRVGANNFMMAGSHLGHDVQIGDENVLANNVLLAGHVKMGSRAFLGGASAYHQGVRIGDIAMVQGLSVISQDVPPFTMCAIRNEVHGLNAIGMRRAGLDGSTRKSVKAAYELIFRSGKNLTEALEFADGESFADEARGFLEFFRNLSPKGVCRPPHR